MRPVAYPTQECVGPPGGNYDQQLLTLEGYNLPETLAVQIRVTADDSSNTVFVQAAPAGYGRDRRPHCSAGR